MLTPLTLFSSDSFGDVPILSSHLKCVSGLVAFQVSVVKMHHHLCMLMLRIKILLIIRGQNHHDSWLKVNTKSKLVCTYCILYTDFTELSRKKSGRKRVLSRFKGLHYSSLHDSYFQPLLITINIY